MSLAPSLGVMRIVSIKTATCAAAFFVGVSVSPIVARQSGPRDARGSATAQVQPQSQRTPLGPGEEELEGTLEVLVEDHQRGAVVHHFLNTDRGKIRLLEALGESDLKGALTGQQVRARGRRSQDGGSLQLRSGGSSGGDSSITTMALATSNTFGEQRVLVIMVNFQDNTAISTDYSSAYDTTFGAVNSFYQENSYGQTYLTGDVVGTYTLPMSAGVCDSTQIQTLAEKAASNAGVNVNNYSRRIFAFPNNACSWWGLGNVGGNPSRAWINGSYALKVVAHELGHNFGDYHSGSESCENGACSVATYGNDRDMMGGYGTGHFNAFQKERLGWLNYAGSPSIQTVTTAGTYFISALQGSVAGPKALKVLKTSSSGGNTNYYVEARAQIGFDAGYAPGVLIHSGNDSNGNSSLQIDMDPFTSAYDTMLDAGQSFTDSARNVTFRTVSADATGAWVSVEMAGAPCTQRAPALTISPSGTISATAGVTASVTMTVKNTDDNGCAAATFEPQLAAPEGWSWVSAFGAISLTPGSSKAVALAVTPASTAVGSYGMSSNVVRTSSSGPSNSTTITMSVAAPSPTPTPTPTPTPEPPPAPPADLAVSLVATSSGAPFTLTATVRNNGALASGITVKFTLKDPRDGVQNYTATTNSLGVANVKGRLKPRDPRGAYVATATATFGGSTSVSSAGFIY